MGLDLSTHHWPLEVEANALQLNIAICHVQMEVVKLLQEHWLFAGVFLCISWPALLIFSPIYVPPVLLYLLYVRYNQWKVDPGQSSQVSTGKEEPVDCTTTEKQVIRPASEAQLPTEQAPNPACKPIEEEEGAKVVLEDEKHEASNQDCHQDQGSSETSSQVDNDHQKKSLLSPSQAKLSTKGNGEESGQAKQSGNVAALDAEGPTSESSAMKAAIGGSTGSPALAKPKIQPLAVPVNADPPKKAAVVSPRKPPVVSPKISAVHVATKSEVASVKKPAEKRVDASAVTEGTEAPGKVVAQPSKKQTPDASKALETPKEPSTVAGHEAEKSQAAASKTSSGANQAVHVRPASGKQEQSPAVTTVARPMLEATAESALPSSSEPVPSVGVSPREAKGSNGQGKAASLTKLAVSIDVHSASCWNLKRGGSL